MPEKLHIEHHFASSELVRDIVIGMSDGLTVPFALAAGLSGAVTSAATISAAYVVGGLLPLAPYMAVHNASSALLVSVCVTLFALAIFGYIKGRFTAAVPMKSALQTVMIGGVAAAAAFGLAKL